MGAKETSSNADERAKAGSIKTLIRNIDSWMFCLCLSGCADIYDIFGEFAIVCQEVDVLPYERYDKAHAVLSKYSKMLEFFEHEDCPPDPDTPDKKKCRWNRYHEDMMLMKTEGKFIGVKIKHTCMGTSRQTRLQSSSSSLQIAVGIDLAKERIKTLLWRIQDDLKTEVFDKETVDMIENI